MPCRRHGAAVGSGKAHIAVNNLLAESKGVNTSAVGGSRRSGRIDSKRYRETVKEQPPTVCRSTMRPLQERRSTGIWDFLQKNRNGTSPSWTEPQGRGEVLGMCAKA